jgi:hypothetical protein
MPAGELVTVPIPVTPTLSVLGGAEADENVAETLCAAFIVTVQLPVPLHAPPQPAKLDPAAGVAVRLTCVPAAKLAPHVVPQLIPAGALVTVPLPARPTVNVKEDGGFCENVAETLRTASIITVQLPVPLHAPPQPVKLDPAAGVAVRLTEVPGGKLALHVAPQLIPPGELVTVPFPVSLTVRLKGGLLIILTVP